MCKRISFNQTDPKQRITVRQLLTHPWMMEGYETPVKWQTRSLALTMVACLCSAPSDFWPPRYRTAVLDEQVVGEMANHFGVSRQTQVGQICTQILLLWKGLQATINWCPWAFSHWPNPLSRLRDCCSGSTTIWQQLILSCYQGDRSRTFKWNQIDDTMQRDYSLQTIKKYIGW